MIEIHRIINHSQFTKNQFDYLIKWRELAYEQVDIALYKQVNSFFRQPGRATSLKFQAWMKQFTSTGRTENA